MYHVSQTLIHCLPEQPISWFFYENVRWLRSRQDHLIRLNKHNLLGSSREQAGWAPQKKDPKISSGLVRRNTGLTAHPGTFSKSMLSVQQDPHISFKGTTIPYLVLFHWTSSNYWWSSTILTKHFPVSRKVAIKTCNISNKSVIANKMVLLFYQILNVHRTIKIGPVTVVLRCVHSPRQI